MDMQAGKGINSFHDINSEEPAMKDVIFYQVNRRVQ